MSHLPTQPQPQPPRERQPQPQPLTLTLTLTAALALTACGPHAPAARPEAQGLRVVCAVDEAVVLLDDRPVGTAAQLRDRDLPILPGPHRLEVRAERFFPRYQDVAITPGARVRVEVTLRPRLEVP